MALSLTSGVLGRAERSCGRKVIGGNSVYLFGDALGGGAQKRQSAERDRGCTLSQSITTEGEEEAGNRLQSEGTEGPTVSALALTIAFCFFVHPCHHDLTAEVDKRSR